MSLTKWGKVGDTTTNTAESNNAVIAEPFVLHGILINHDQSNDALIELYDALTVTGTPVVKFNATLATPYYDLGDVQFTVGLSTKVTVGGGGVVTWAVAFEL